MIPANTQIWLVAGVTDMRRGFTSLSGLVQSALEKSRQAGSKPRRCGPNRYAQSRAPRDHFRRCELVLDGGRSSAGLRLDLFPRSWRGRNPTRCRHFHYQPRHKIESHLLWCSESTSQIGSTAPGKPGRHSYSIPPRAIGRFRQLSSSHQKFVEFQ